MAKIDWKTTVRGLVGIKFTKKAWKVIAVVSFLVGYVALVVLLLPILSEPSLLYSFPQPPTGVVFLLPIFPGWWLVVVADEGPATPPAVAVAANPAAAAKRKKWARMSKFSSEMVIPMISQLIHNHFNLKSWDWVIASTCFYTFLMALVKFHGFKYDFGGPGLFSSLGVAALGKTGGPFAVTLHSAITAVINLLVEFLSDWSAEEEQDNIFGP